MNPLSIKLLRRLQGRPVVKKILGNAGWMVADRLFRMGVGVVVTALMARHLAPEGFGLLNFSLAFVALFSVFSSLGLDGILMRDLVKMPEQREQIVASALILRLSGSTISLVLAVLGIMLLHPGDFKMAIVVFILALGVFPQFFDVFDNALQSAMRTRPVVVIRGLAFLLFAALKLLLIWQQASVEYFAMAITGELAVAALALVAFVRKEGGYVSLRSASRRECLRQLREAWPLILSGIAVTIYMRLDQVLIGQFLGVAEVGVFSAAMRIIEVTYFVPLSLGAAVYPALTAAYSKSKEEFEEKIKQLYLIMSILGYVMALSIFLFGGLAIDMLFGHKYTVAGEVVEIVAPVCVFVSVSAIYTKWILIMRMQHYHLLFSIIAAVLSVSVNVILIPVFGIKGAAVGVLFSQMLPFVFLFAFQKFRRNGISMLEAVLLPLGIWHFMRARHNGSRIHGVN